MFGRKRKPTQTPLSDEEAAGASPAADADDARSEGAPENDDVAVDDTDDVSDDTAADDAEDDERDEDPDELDDEDDGIDAVPPEPEEIDWRADGPFDAEEVELGDEVRRLDLGALVVTPFDGLQLQLQVNPETKQAGAFTAIWRQSGLEVALFAASSGGGMAEEFLEDVLEEAAQAGGSATIEDGPFGPQVRRLLPEEGKAPTGKKKDTRRVHVSWVWFAEGPRWLLRGTLLGEAAIGATDAPEAAPFVEFFRNIVVRRGGKPMVPGDQVPLDVPVGDDVSAQ